MVENVVPYYPPLIKPTAKVGRHLFWSNFEFTAEEVPSPANFIKLGTVAAAKELKRWLGLDYVGNIYYGKNHCAAQVLRNCVHPDLGLEIFEAAMTHE